MTGKRYQVFLSSTFIDLEQERIAVTQAILNLRGIPAGMELFQASTLPPWDVITPIIDTTDYFVLMLAGRYGSIGDGGISYTEREYDYAYEHGIPVLAFLHEAPQDIPAKFVDTGRQAKALTAFRQKVSGRHTIMRWRDPAGLAQKVATALIDAFQTTPRPGYVRGNDRDPREEPERVLPPSSPGPPLTYSVAVQAALVEPGGPGRIAQWIRTQAASVAQLPLASGEAPMDNIPNLSEELRSRVGELEEASKSLVRLVAATARWGNEGLDRAWIEGIDRLNNTLIVGGYSSLIALMRAPAALAFHAAGLGALMGDRYEVVSQLLSENFLVEDPHAGKDVPAVTFLREELLYQDANNLPGRQFSEYLLTTLDEGYGEWSRNISQGMFDRWSYLVAVANTFLGASSEYRVVSPLPYLKVEWSGADDTMRVPVGKALRRDVKRLGDRHPLLSAGFCDGDPNLFEEACATFESRYGRWGREQDYRALPGGSGFLISGPHYPGER